MADEVVCIHGFMRKASCMKPLEKRLKEEGFSVSRWGYPSRKKTISQHADDLVAFLQTRHEPLHFVTHSLGGIILRAALNHPDCPPQAREGRIILLAPPNHGSKTARRLCHLPTVRSIFGPFCGRELLHYTHDEIKAFGPLPPTTTVIAGKKDWKVRLEETHLETQHKHYIVPCGHCFIMCNKEVQKIVIDSLRAFPYN